MPTLIVTDETGDTIATADRCRRAALIAAIERHACGPDSHADAALTAIGRAIDWDGRGEFVAAVPTRDGSNVITFTAFRVGGES